MSAFTVKIRPNLFRVAKNEGDREDIVHLTGHSEHDDDLTVHNNSATAITTTISRSHHCCCAVMYI